MPGNNRNDNEIKAVWKVDDHIDILTYDRPNVVAWLTF